jgi:hypothetical protein
MMTFVDGKALVLKVNLNFGPVDASPNSIRYSFSPQAHKPAYENENKTLPL